MFSLIKVKDEGHLVVFTSQLKKLDNSKSKYLYGSVRGAGKIVYLVNKSDNKRHLEQKKITVEATRNWVDDSSDDAVDYSPKQHEYQASTPINLKNQPSLVVRLSDIRKSGGSITDSARSESSIAPSIPSRLLDFLESLSDEASGITENPNFSTSKTNKSDDEKVHSQVNSVYSADVSSDESDTVNKETAVITKKRKLKKQDFVIDHPRKKKKVRYNQKKKKVRYNQKTDSRCSDKNLSENTRTISSFSAPSNNDSTFDPESSSLIKEQENNSKDDNSKSLIKNVSSSFETIIPFKVDDLTVPVSKFVPKDDSTSKPGILSKQYFCIYCKELVIKFARHLENHHKDESDVREFLELPLRSQKRLDKIAVIRNKGTLLYNTNKELNSGILLTSRRCQVGFKRNATDYLPCSKCNAYFSKQTLRIHFKKCIPEHERGVHDILSMSRRKVCYIHERANELLRKSIFPVLNDNDVKDTIAFDEIIILYGNFLCDKYVHIRHHGMIRSDLRYIGRHKLAIMELNPEIKEYSSIFHPEHVDTAMKALRTVAMWNEKKLMLDTPAVAMKMTTLVRKVAKRFKSECIRKGQKERKIEVEEFMDLWQEEIQQLINKKAI